MINVSIDCESDLSPGDWRKMDRWQLELFAKEGNVQQKRSLIDWAYAGLPAWMFEELYFLVHGEEWQQD